MLNSRASRVTPSSGLLSPLDERRSYHAEELLWGVLLLLVFR